MDRTQKDQPRQGDPRWACLRLDPQRRLAPRFDDVTIAKFRVAGREMGFRVLDDFCEEHIM